MERGRIGEKQMKMYKFIEHECILSPHFRILKRMVAGNPVVGWFLLFKGIEWQWTTEVLFCPYCGNRLETIRSYLHIVELYPPDKLVEELERKTNDD
jgi:hypothetical protein